MAMCWNPMYSQYLAVSSSAVRPCFKRSTFPSLIFATTQSQAVCLSSTDMNASSTVCKAEVMVWDLRKNASLSSPHSNDVDLSPTCVSHFRTSGSRVNCLRWHPANSHLLGTSCNVPGDNFQQGCVVEVGTRVAYWEKYYHSQRMHAFVCLFRCGTRKPNHSQRAIARSCQTVRLVRPSFQLIAHWLRRALVVIIISVRFLLQFIVRTLLNTTLTFFVVSIGR